MAWPLLWAVTERLSLLDRWLYWVSGILLLTIAFAVANGISIMSDMRTHCVHVDLPIRLFHGANFHASTQRRANLHVHGHGHIFFRLYGMHQWHILGPTQ